jgi:hypothetical protein
MGKLLKGPGGGTEHAATRIAVRVDLLISE